LYKKLDDHLRSAFDSNNLSEVLLVSGEFQTALERANDAVSFIDRTEDKYRQSSYRAAQAHVLATLGKTREAKVLFEDAEQRQIQGRPRPKSMTWATTGKTPNLTNCAKNSNLAALPPKSISAFRATPSLGCAGQHALPAVLGLIGEALRRGGLEQIPSMWNHLRR